MFMSKLRQFDTVVVTLHTGLVRLWWKCTNWSGHRLALIIIAALLPYAVRRGLIFSVVWLLASGARHVVLDTGWCRGEDYDLQSGGCYCTFVVACRVLTVGVSILCFLISFWGGVWLTGVVVIMYILLVQTPPRRQREHRLLWGKIVLDKIF